MNKPREDDKAADLALIKQATEEMNSGKRNQELWYKAFAESSGSEQATKSAYIQLRVDELRRAASAAAARTVQAQATIPPAPATPTTPTTPVEPAAPTTPVEPAAPATPVEPAAPVVQTVNTASPQLNYRFEVDGFPFGLNKKSLEIFPDSIRLDGAFIPTHKVSHITISITQHSINGVKKGTTHQLEVGSKDKSITIKLHDKSDGSSNEKVFHEINDAVMEFAGKSLLKRMVESIMGGDNIAIGSAEFSAEGAWLAERTLLIFKNAPVLVPYNRLWFTLGGGKVFLSDSQNRKTTATFPLLSTRNACMVGPLYNLLIKPEVN